jgi:hypothetical protein
MPVQTAGMRPAFDHGQSCSDNSGRGSFLKPKPSRRIFRITVVPNSIVSPARWSDCRSGMAYFESRMKA